MQRKVQNDIVFNTVYTGGEDAGGTLIDDTLRMRFYSDENPIINGIEIDWNGAQLPNSGDTAGNQEINHTGELLKLINEMNKRIYTLTAAVIALSNKI